MPYLNYVSDENLESIVSDVLAAGQKALQSSITKFNRNVIDPFAILFELATFNTNIKAWEKSEAIRQAQKSLVNAIGAFHQKILGACDGWENVNEVVDLVCHEKKIIAEIKNKHNTIKGSELYALYTSLSEQIHTKGHSYKDYTAYYVEIIPKKATRYDKPFRPSNNKTGKNSNSDEKIRQIDGSSFYTLATGRVDALEELFTVLPKVIKKLMPSSEMDNVELIKKYFMDAFHLKGS